MEHPTEAAMEQWNALQKWVDEHRDVVFDLLRIYLGIGLFVKGLQFISDREFLSGALRASGAEQFKFDFMPTLLAQYIPLAHIGGGLLLTLGFLTRTATLFQLPVLIGAVFFVYGKNGMFTHNQEFQFTALVLFLLMLILIHGPGRLSVDGYLKNRPTA
jgi:uncharacterized membrane protein YphA (DoxX/SURF4 family)